MKGFERFVKKVNSPGPLLKKSPLMTGRPLTAEYDGGADSIGIAVELLKEIRAAHDAVSRDAKCDPNLRSVSRAIQALAMMVAVNIGVADSTTSL